jgi:hypothetical protein
MRLKHEIPVTLAVKHYLEHWKPAYNGRPYLITMDDFIGLWLINALARKTEQVTPCDKQKFAEAGFHHSWTFTVPSRYQDRLVLPARRAYEFNAMIRKLMYLELISEIESLRLKGDPFYVQQALNDFRYRYNILEKHLPDERLRQMYQRFRTRNNTLKKELSAFWPGMLLVKIKV